MTILSIFTPLLLNKIIEYLQMSKDEDKNIAYGWLYIFGYILINLVYRIIEQHAMFYQELIGQEASNTLKIMIYNKTLRISSYTTNKLCQGEIMNLVQIDTSKVWEMAYYIPGVLKMPIQFGFWLIFLYSHFGFYIL